MTPTNYPPPIYHESNDPLQDGDSLDIKRYLSLFISNWYWFAISLFVAMTITYGLNRYGEKIYTVSSTLLIKDEQKGGVNNVENYISGSSLFNNQQNLINEIGILKSFSLNLRVIDSLPEFRVVYYGVGKRNLVESILYTECPFEVITDQGDSKLYDTKIHIRIKSDSTYKIEINKNLKNGDDLKFGEKYKNGQYNFTIKLRHPDWYRFNPEFSNKYFFYFPNPQALANVYRNRLSVSPIDKDATVLKLSVAGAVPQQEADYLNKLMDIYISQGLEAKNQIADSTLSFIDRQLSIIADSLKNAEDKLQAFRLDNKLLDLSKEGSIIQSRLEQFENEKSSLGLQYKYYQYLEDYIESRNESGDIVSPSIMGVNDQSLNRLVQELASSQKKKSELALNLGENLPPVNLLNENITIARESLNENVKNSILNIEREISDLSERINKANEDVQRLPVTERQLLGIQRKFDLNNTVYTYLLEKRAETGIARASNVSNTKIVDRADVYNSVRIKPKESGNRLKALIMAILIPGVLITLLYYFNNRIIDNGDITRRTKVPIVGYISHSESKHEIPVVDNPGSALAESFRAVRTALRYFIKDTKCPVIAMTSTISSEGKTFMSVNLAAITAMLGKRVLLIGLDLRKPRIHKILGIDNSEGMSTYLSNNCQFEDVIKATEVDNLFYATSGPVPPNPAELINGIRMKEFIQKAQKDYDFIIIDTPPLAVVSDTLLLADLIDINLFVVRQRFSSKNTLTLIQELYQGEKLRNMGIIINDISLTGYYGYGLRYGYYKGYGYSYGKDYYGSYSYSKYGYNDGDKSYYES
jgi:tyrosine-protein kinase Etk/Wzc